ncbi:MAG TPA: hypothetical protein VJT73_09385 [Polyangiaceae bacterium]|nr:hypothetical protein [Polyangiaceae bacterium]
MREPIPIPIELFHAFPVGTLSLLASMAGVISAEHGVDTARDLFALLASSEPFWAELRARFEASSGPRVPPPELPDGAVPGNRHERMTP